MPRDAASVIIFRPGLSNKNRDRSRLIAAQPGLRFIIWHIGLFREAAGHDDRACHRVSNQVDERAIKH